MAMHTLGNQLLRLLALSLELSEDAFATPYLFLRPIRYEGCLSKPSEGILGAGEACVKWAALLSSHCLFTNSFSRQTGSWLLTLMFP